MAITDSFTRADQSPITTPWTPGAGGYGNVNLISNACRSAVAETDTAGFYQGTFPNDQYAQVVKDLVSGLYRYGGPAVRCSSDGDLYSLNADGTGTYFIERVDNGSTFTHIGANFSQVGVDLATIKLVVTGTTLEGFHNGVSMGTRTDSTYASGNPGLSFYVSATAGVLLDDFECSDVVGGDKLFAANMQATADLGSFLRADRTLAASIDVSADFAAMARIDRALASFLQATADLGANLNADRPIAASLSATADFSGNINVDRPLAANVTIDADWLAALTVLTGGEVLLAASLLSTADLESFLRVDRPLAANLEATADLLGFARIDRPIAANLNVNADLLAFLRADRPLAANVNVTADWLAALTVLTGGDVLLAVAFLATADFSGNINVERTLAALFQSNADWLAALTITNLIIVVPFDPNITDVWTIPGGGRTFTIPGGGRTYTIPK